MISFNVVHPLNKSASIDRIVIFVNDVHLSKELLPIVFTDAGIMIFFNDVHPLNESFLFDEIDVGISTLTSDEQQLNVPSRILITEHGIIICLNDEQCENEFDPIDEIDVGIEIPCKEEHPLNAFELFDETKTSIRMLSMSFLFCKNE